jgi:hypothetical protein
MLGVKRLASFLPPKGLESNPGREDVSWYLA